MKLILNNIASINQKSEIDLSRKILIFVGENNSGKTYIAQLIWAIFNILNVKNDIDIEFSNTKIEDNKYIININKKDLKKISEVFSNYIKENIKDIFTFNNFNFDFEIVLEYDKFLATIIKDSLGLDLILLPITKNANTQEIIIKKFKHNLKKEINRKVFYMIIKSLTNHQTDFLLRTSENSHKPNFRDFMK